MIEDIFKRMPINLNAIPYRIRILRFENFFTLFVGITGTLAAGIGA